jgi:hypothetical protein
MRSALGHSSRPPARIGKIITPGENHHADTCTEATAMAIVTTERTNASRRFLVMNCLRARPRSDTAAAETADQSRRDDLETMMAKTVPVLDLAATPHSWVFFIHMPPDLRRNDLATENKSP